MKLAVFTSEYPTRVATFFERDMRALLESGIDIEIFACRPLDAGAWQYSLDLLDEGRLPRTKVHHIAPGESLASGLRTLVREPATLARDTTASLASAARYGLMPFAKTAYALPKAWAWAGHDNNERFDHVLGYWGNYAGTCAYAFHRLLGRSVPFSIWLHAGTDLYRTPVFMKQKLTYADNIITCCDFNREYILQEYVSAVPGLTHKVHVCHHGLDLAGFPFELDARGSKHVVAVGRLARRKGFDYLLRAAHLLRGRNVDVTIELVGDGAERAALQRLAADLGIAEFVQFRGWLPFSAARRAMSEATLLVHPSTGLGDGLPNVVREAMALGTPVIASRVAGIPDALEDGCGVLVEPNDAPALSNAIERLLENPAERRAIAVRARQRVEERYDLWRNGARLARLLRTSKRASTAPEPAHARRRSGHRRVQPELPRG
jgi:colanic acid/amylovoran biosynthesis glycosyltransferase